MSSFFHSSSNAALHSNMPVLITGRYTSLWWVYHSTHSISLLPVSVAANKKNCHFQTDTHMEPQGQFYTNSLYSFPVDYDLSIVESSERFFGSFILLGSAWVYKSLPILVPTQSHTLRKEFTTTISCDILAIQLTFDLMWYLCKFYKNF